MHLLRTVSSVPKNRNFRLSITDLPKTIFIVERKCQRHDKVEVSIQDSITRSTRQAGSGNAAAKASRGVGMAGPASQPSRPTTTGGI